MPRLNKVALAAFLCVSAAHAENVSLDFKSASVLDVVQTVVKEVAKRDYVISPDVILSDRRITVSVKQVDSTKVLELLDSVLQTVDVRMNDRGGVLYVEKSFAGPVAVPVQQIAQPGQIQAGQGVPIAQNGMQPQRIPEEIESYRPRGRTVEFLSAVAKAAGADVIENMGKGDLLVYSGSREAMDKARHIIAQVDTAPVSVNVRAVLVEFTEGNTESRSLNIALSALAGKIGAVLQAGNQLVNALSYKGSTLTAALSAIDGDTRFKYLAEPSIRVLDGEQAKLVVGSEVPTRGAVTTDKSGNSQQSIEYRTAGVVINLEPRVLDGLITMKIGQQISSFSLTSTSNIDSPTILKREAVTTVSMKPGELIMLAGMDEKRESASSSGVWFLPPFMRSNNLENGRSQLVLMLEAVPDIPDHNI